MISALLIGFGLGWHLHRADGTVAPTTSVAATVPSAPVVTMHGVKRVDATHYEIERHTIDELLADPDALGRFTSIVPVYVDGGPGGLRLLGVRPGSVAVALGLENGDRIETLNGYSVAKPETALDAYSSLRHANDATLTLERNGAPVTIHYRATN